MVDPMQPVPYTVVRVRRETTDTCTLVMQPAQGTSGFAFAPGQFNMLYAFGVGEAPISISGDPGDQSYVVHTVRAVGPVTRAITRLKKGEALGLRGPFGSCWPVEEAHGSDVVMVAGGLGLAPLRPALYQVLAQREKFGKVVLLYGTRAPQNIIYSMELERWRRLGVNVYVTVDRASERWMGEVGAVTRLIAKATFDPLNTVFLVCGPEIMMRFAITELDKLGVGPESIFISLERNMKCAVGFCGHCQFGPTFICKDGPVFNYSKVKDFFWKKEV